MDERRRIGVEELAEIRRKHGLWCRGMDGGSRANLSRANLSEADLSEANLSRANLSRANLSEADLSEANLSRADLSGANLSRANLSWANLTRANLSRANLAGANLAEANLSEANLTGANLSEANLSGADLSEAYLTVANLTGANLSEAILEPIKKDFLSAILYLPGEIPFLRQALVDGRVDGSTYEGECACLAGTMAHATGLNWEEFQEEHLMPIGSGSPRERWFLAICQGDTPENNPVVAITLGWIDEALALIPQSIANA
jgi:hypothetical protein